MAAFAMAHLGVRPAFALLAGALAAVAGARAAMLAFVVLAAVALLLLRRSTIFRSSPTPTDTETTMPVTAGQTAPDFTLPGPSGMWSLSSHQGRPVVLYFYPKDGTPGCTTQACQIRDHWDEFESRGVAVVGISPDPPSRHAGFAEEHGLPQVLLSDEDHEVLQAYGMWREKVKDGKPVMGVARSSVVIDAQGRVVAVLDPLDPEDQASRALDALAHTT